MKTDLIKKIFVVITLLLIVRFVDEITVPAAIPAARIKIIIEPIVIINTLFLLTTNFLFYYSVSVAATNFQEKLPEKCALLASAVTAIFI